MDPDRVQSCVRIGPDRFRRHIGEIRGLALFDDIPFGIVICGDLVAIFQRHPGYRPAVADEIRAEFAKRQGKAPPDLLNRVSVLEAAVERLIAKLDDQSALIHAMRQRMQRDKT